MKPKLLWVGGLFSVCGGQARVTRYTIPELQRLGYEILNIGQGTQILEEGETLPCRCQPWAPADEAGLHGVIDSFKPDLMLLSHDCWLFYCLPALKAKYPALKIIGWFTIDAHPIHHSFCPIFRACDYLCSPTQFGRDTIMQRWPEKGVEVVPYGVSPIYRL